MRELDTRTGEQRVVAGNGLDYQPGMPDGIAAVDLRFDAPLGLAVGPDGDLFVAEGGFDAYWFNETRVWRIDRETGLAHSYVGGATRGGCDPDVTDCAFADTWLMMPRALAFDGAGNLFMSDHQRHRVFRVDATTRTVRTVAGTKLGLLGTGQCTLGCEPPGLGDGGPATSASLKRPNGSPSMMPAASCSSPTPGTAACGG